MTTLEEQFTKSKIEYAESMHKKAIKNRCVACPAASLNSQGVFCGIEKGLISIQGDPGTLGHLCTDRYDLCTSWRRARDENRDQLENAKKVKRDHDRQIDNDNEYMEQFERKPR